jgi:hypothetical protein
MIAERASIPAKRTAEQVMRGNLYNVFWWILAHAFGASIVAFFFLLAACKLAIMLNRCRA